MEQKKDVVIDVDNVTVRFNLASQKIDNLKEYVIKIIKRELMFQEFLALQDVSFQVRRGMGADWYKWFWKINDAESN